MRFNECKFHVISSHDSEKQFSFKNVIFAQEVNFSESEFWRLPDMTGTDFRNGINLDKTLFPNDITYKKITFGKTITQICKRVWFCITKKRFKVISKWVSVNYSNFHRDADITWHALKTETNKASFYENAEVTWHILQIEMEKSGYHQKAMHYFGCELDAKYLNPETDNFFKGVLWLYKKLSDYGKSIGRPLQAWIGAIFMFFFVYFCFLGEIIPSFHLSLKGAVPFVSDQTTFFDRMLADPIEPESEECTRKSHYPENIVMRHIFPCDEVKLPKITLSQKASEKEPIPFNNTLELYIFPFFHGLHTLFSLVCFFLFGLGVRNRLRLK